MIVANDCLILHIFQIGYLGKSHYRYDSFHSLLVTVGLPSVGQVLSASKEQPFNPSQEYRRDPGVPETLSTSC